MNASQVADFIEEAVRARVDGRTPYLAGMVDGLLAGPSALDAARVVCTMAAASAEALHRRPGEDFHRFPHAEDQSRMSPHLTCYLRMAVSLANDEPEDALSLFAGFVARDRGNAARLVMAGLNQLSHQVTCPGCCPPSMRKWLL